MKPWAFFRPLWTILASLLTVGLCSIVLVLLLPSLSTAVVAMLYLIPVVISAAFWGRLAGISASILSFLVFLYFFVPPYGTFQVAQPPDVLVMVVLLGVAVLISGLMARVQSNLTQTQAREREAVQLYELGVALSAQNDPTAVARTLAQAYARLFPTARVEILVGQAEPIVLAGSPDRIPQASPALQFPLFTTRGTVGEVRIGNLASSPSTEEQRLIQTFASQGALALDRTLLADSETRARVLEESDRLKTAILSSVSHELRTPLATIQAAATSLFNPAVDLEPPARAELQSLLLEETDRMIQLMGNLLNMSRLEAGALKLQRQWNAFAEIVDASVRRLNRVATHHRIIVDVSEDLPLVSLDSVLMEQVMINLIRNSLKYAPVQSAIQIRAKADAENLQVTVQNAGPPIPAEYLQHIFEKFYPIPGKETIPGTGLGLSICKGIIEAHGGTIWAANLPDGVAFHFSLPLFWEGTHPAEPKEESEGA